MKKFSEIDRKIEIKNQALHDKIVYQKEYNNLLIQDWYSNVEKEKEDQIYKKHFVLMKHSKSRINNSMNRTAINNSVISNK